MNRLKDRLLSMIAADGPMPLSAYMTLCLHDPETGYYATRPGLGRDFITAPEISQIFGELVGLWAADTWSQLGSPEPVILSEIGPGRGTLMSDALRATRGLAGFHAAINLHLVEASPALRAEQAQRVRDVQPRFASSIADLPNGPTILLANEYLDCLPARQFVHDRGDWRERVIGADTDQKALRFGLSIDRAPMNAFPSSPVSSDQNVEVQPGLDHLIDALAERAKSGEPLVALFIDYGVTETAPQDTLRAFQNGTQIHPLSAPGESDLTVDVDFGRFKRLAVRHGLNAFGPVDQGPWLLSLGAEKRLNQLAQTAKDGGQSLYEGVKRLVDPAEMGSRFKVIALSNIDSLSPAGF